MENNTEMKQDSAFNIVQAQSDSFISEVAKTLSKQRFDPMFLMTAKIKVIVNYEPHCLCYFTYLVKNKRY